MSASDGNNIDSQEEEEGIDFAGRRGELKEPKSPANPSERVQDSDRTVDSSLTRCQPLMSTLLPAAVAGSHRHPFLSPFFLSKLPDL